MTSLPTGALPRRAADATGGLAAHENAAVTALLTSLFAGTRLPSASEGTSARAAYQDALYDRATLVDLRPTPARLADGELGLPSVTLDADHGRAMAQVHRLAETTPVVLVSTDGVLAARVAAQLRALGMPWVEAVAGGFAGWRTAGLPITRAVAWPAVA